MQTISGFPYAEVQFNKDGAIHDENEAQQVLNMVTSQQVTDLFVISHGWNNNLDEARELYKGLFALVRKELNGNVPPPLRNRSFAVMGILWPSKKFEDAELIASGAAGFGGELTEEEELRQRLDSLKGVFDNPEADSRLEEAKKLLNRAQSDENAGVKLIELLRTLPAKDDKDPEDGSEKFFTLPGHELADKLSRPDVPVTTGNTSGGSAAFESGSNVRAGGEAAGFNLFGGIMSAIRKALNFTTYYQMKERAGIVGKNGAHKVLSRVREKKPGIKIHLIGHSFGGRLVTSIADGPKGGKPILPSSMTLLQAAFSHNGFAGKFDGKRDGFFRKVISENKVKGPIVITHSIKDTAVGMAYPIASKLSGDDAATFGDKDSLFGGIGRNGAQRTIEAVNDAALGPATTVYPFKAGKIYNLNSDKIILGHSDIIRPQVVHAILSAVAAP
jgi:hypothetical protein